MSLLDDVSIVVTPNGYKAGELYAVIPVPTEGSEQVTNGDFATDSDWSKATGVTISGGNAIFNNSTANNNGIYQGTVFQANTQYKITAEVSNYSSGNVTAWSGGSQNINSNESFTGNGTKTWIISTGASNGYILLSSATTNGNFNIDNISVKEYTSADMDVTRATAATRVDENGLVNYAEVIGSEEITNGDFATNLDSWSTSSWWVWNSLGAYHPSTGSHKPLYQQCCVIGKTYKITFDLNCVGSSLAKFSLGSSTGSTTQVIDTSLASGSYSYFVTAAAEYIVFNRQNTAEYYVNNVSVKEVTRDNVPRIDYTGGGCPHILAEPQRTNEVTYSEDFSNAYFQKIRSTISTDQIVSPDGTLSGDKFIEDSALGTKLLWTQDEVVSIGDVLTWSVFAKKGERDWIVLQESNAGNFYAFFDLDNGVIGTTSGVDSSKIEDLGSGWYRCSITYTTTGTTAKGRLYLADSDNSQSYQGNGTSGLYIWGAQLELGSYATSYIPTSGSTVTRNQDIFSRDGIGSLINSTEGVLFAEIAALTDNDATSRSICLSDGTSGNRILFRYEGNNLIRGFVLSANTIYANFSFTYNNINNLKFAIKWKVNDFAYWVNGTEVLTDNSGNVPTGLNRLALDNGSGTQDFYGKVKQLQVYKTALTDVQLAALTS